MTPENKSFIRTIIPTQRFLLGFLIGIIAVQLMLWQIFLPITMTGTTLLILLLQLLRKRLSGISHP